MIYLFDGEAAETPAAADTPPAAADTPPAAADTPPAQVQETPWYEKLPEELRTDPDIAKYQTGTLEDFARAHQNLAKLRGVPADKLTQLPDPADTQGYRELMQKVGLPKTIEDPSYALTETKGEDGQPLGPNFSSQGPLAQAFRKACFDEGVPAGAMQKVFHQCNTALKQLHDAGLAEVTKRQEENLVVLKRELGEAYEEKTNAADFAAGHLGIIDILNGAGIGTEPAIQKALASIAPLLAEQTALGGLPSAAGGKLTREAAAAKAKTLQAEALRLPVGDRRRKELNEQAAELWKVAV